MDQLNFLFFMILILIKYYIILYLKELLFLFNTIIKYIQYIYL